MPGPMPMVNVSPVFRNLNMLRYIFVSCYLDAVRVRLRDFNLKRFTNIYTYKIAKGLLPSNRIAKWLIPRKED